MSAEMLHGAGYRATGIKDIVAAANVPKGSFYTYFESKEVFGKEAIDFYFSSGIDSLRAQLCDNAIPPLERLRAYFSDRMQVFADTGFIRGCLLGNFSLEVADQSALIRERLSAHFNTWGTLFEECIAEGQRDGSIRNSLSAALLAQFLLNSWEGALLRMRAEESAAPLRQFIEVVFGSLHPTGTDARHE